MDMQAMSIPKCCFPLASLFLLPVEPVELLAAIALPAKVPATVGTLVVGNGPVYVPVMVEVGKSLQSYEFVKLAWIGLCYVAEYGVHPGCPGFSLIPRPLHATNCERGRYTYILIDDIGTSDIFICSLPRK
jgi:hypothetical protein